MGLVASDYGVATMLAVPQGVGDLPAGLYVGGEIDQAGVLDVNSLARWDGADWHDVGGGVTRPGTTIPYVFAMAVFDEDSEGPLPPALFVGGQFEHAGAVSAHALARWDGREWSEVGGGINPGVGHATIFAMAVYDDGRGPALYVAGRLRSAGGKEAWNIARWDGAEWEPLGPGINGAVHALHVFDEDGPGPLRPALFAGGSFSEVPGGEPGSMGSIGRWDGIDWTPVGGFLPTAGSVRTMTVWDPDGLGPASESLYVGGYFNRLPDGTLSNRVARWDGEQWHIVGGGVTGFGAGTGLECIAVFDEDGAGPNPGGDCDGDSAHTFFDFLCFQNAFGAGCP
jgi:trimeric autotransporter adhesin